jgi:hypothetical protein
MYIRITAHDDESFGIDYLTGTFSHDASTGKYRMAAGGYDIVGSGLPQPVKKSGEGNLELIEFYSTEEALTFFLWLKKTDVDAKESFTRMLD